jgi:hypothetical protein
VEGQESRRDVYGQGWGGGQAGGGAGLGGGRKGEGQGNLGEYIYLFQRQDTLLD